MLIRTLLVGLSPFLLAACGDESPRPVDTSTGSRPAWAHVAKEQSVEADRLGVPVAVENQIGMRFVLIPAGSFEMGSDNGDGDERPIHTVAIREPFYMGVTEVTQEQWQKVMGANPSRFEGASRPVERVSWDAAQDFVAKLNARGERSTVSLPTEAQWEYACRAGTKTEWSFGDDEAQTPDFAWIAANAGKTTHAVASKRPNPWGLYDVHGNVWEWCADEGGFGPALRMMRGGSWTNDPRTVRSAFRKRAAPGDAYEYYGLRLAAALPAK